MPQYSHTVKNNTSPIFTPCLWRSEGEKVQYSHMVNKEQQVSQVVAKNVKRMLKERKLAQKWLAEKTGLVDGMISMLLNGTRTMMAYQIERFAAAFDVSASELTYDPDDEELALMREVAALEQADKDLIRSIMARMRAEKEAQ